MRPDVVWPRRLQAVMDKALARDAMQRYQHAADFGREFSMAIDAMPAHDPTEIGTLILDASGKKTPIPRTRVDDEPEPALRRLEPAGTPVARRNATTMLAVGGLAVAGIGFVVAMKLGLIGASTDATVGTQPPPTIDSAGRGTKAPPAMSGSTGLTGSTGSMIPQPRGGGSGGRVVDPPTAPTGATGSRDSVRPPVTPPPTPPPTVTPVSAEELTDLRILSDVEGIDTDPVRASRAIDLADKLLPRATGEARADILVSPWYGPYPYWPKGVRL